MKKIAQHHILRTCILRLIGMLILFCGGHAVHAQAPVNDGCANAIDIPIPSGGYGLGNFISAATDLTNATVQTGESYAPAILVAGLDKKSVWYKFKTSTVRAVRVTLTQPGTTITAGDAGFTVYQTGTCLPGNTSISPKLTPIVTFGNTYHPCVPAGEYLVQVSSKLAANGPVNIEVEVSDQTGAAYDHPLEAYSFGVAANFARKIDFDPECQSIEDSAEVCHSLSNYQDYHKSAWFTFTTPAYFDYMAIVLSGTGSPSYFPSGGSNIFKKFGFNLYRGDVVTSDFRTLPLVDGCDSLLTNGYRDAVRQFRCGDLAPNTTYSIQLFIEKDFKDILRLGLITGGTAPTAAPQPVSGMPASNTLGVLAPSVNGTLVSMTDYFGCNSQHSVSACGTVIPAGNVVIGSGSYNLSSFATFSLQEAAAINFRGVMVGCGPRPIIRLFRHTVTANCADIDTSDLVGIAGFNQEIECLQPGDYVIQVMGSDAPLPLSSYLYSLSASNSNPCLYANLGSQYKLDMSVYRRNAANKFSLGITGAFDSINVVNGNQQPLTAGITYPASPDTVGCQQTLRPWDTTCSTLNDKVIYRQFEVPDSGTIHFSSLVISNSTPFRYRLYRGDANALAAAQNIFSFPDRISGLVPNTICLDGYVCNANKSSCVIPGTYTLTTMASTGDVGRADKPSITFLRTRTLHNSPFTAQDFGSIMDTLGPNGGTKKSDVDYWSCDDNAVAINGYQPCLIGGRPATKAIYRQFYLKEDALVRIAVPGYWGCHEFANGIKTLFYGKATDGFGGLSPVGNQWNCFTSAQTANGCTFLPEGWYTIVSYGTGPSYDSTTRLLNISGRYNSNVGYQDELTITITPACAGPKHNRPYKASVNSSNQPHLVEWTDRLNSTSAYPRRDTTYVLPSESFNCTLDTPFSSHPIRACEAAANRVAYWVFKTTEVCFLQIDAGGYFAAVYDKDVRTDSLQFATATPIQPCNNKAGYIQFCFFQPGTYTLVVFAKDANICATVSPKIYIDQVDYSRFDYAVKAYDFDVVPPDNTFHYGKVGDVNPLNGLRQPSNDFFYCTTGSFDSDPTNGVCNAVVNPNVYNTGPNKPLYDSAFPPTNDISRRNLWYTFVAGYAGTVKVKVESKTLGRGLQPKFTVYKSNVDGTLPFSTVVANGEVDSTIAQGLSFVATNLVFFPYRCYNTSNYVSFYRDPCTSVPTRYYVVVDNVNAFPAEVGGQLPNAQLEVSVLMDSVNLVLPKFDHYSFAGDFGTVGEGAFTGPQDNYSCATRDAPDPVYSNYFNCSKTLWYKFNSTVTGNVRYRIRVDNSSLSHGYDQAQLFREIIPGDSTTRGLAIQTYSTVNTSTGSWAQTCVAPGTYYLLLPGCSKVHEYVAPEIELTEAVGDFCSRAIPAAMNGPGSVTATVLVNCHTIGTDYGEFGPQLTCPPNANTSDYKSSWFRIDITGPDTLDVTTYLEENTNASSSDIKYRLMTGDCGAMQEQSCVLDALTQNTYQCMVPGQSYFVQVFTPVLKNNAAVTGTIDLKLSAILHADTCAPLTNCLVNANFDTAYNCSTTDSVKFVNFSTYGSNISYQWEFGYNNQTSTLVSPSFFYPALPNDQAYTIKLVVTNNGCHQSDSVTKTFTIPGRPYVNLGADIAQCNSTAPIVLRATSHAGATYQWQNNSTADTFKVTATGNNNYWVKVTYNGCSRRDTVKVLISPVSSRPLQQIVLCTDSVQVDVRRGYGETYLWSTGATTRSIYMSTPGYYWVDITYFNCVYRDSFEVNNVNAANPLGEDTTVCLSAGGYLLDAHIDGAQSYQWQNNSTADTFLVTTPGQYRVNINFGNCIVKDTVNVMGYPVPVVETVDTSICEGESIFLPWGVDAGIAGTYSDTLRYGGGCDSLIRQVILSVHAKPFIGNDTTICLGQGDFTIDATTAGALSYTWQDGDTSAVYTVSQPGQYWVQVNYATCSAGDTIGITILSAPQFSITDTASCSGNPITLPWGLLVTDPGTYSDTLVSVGGCDSLVRTYVVAVDQPPSLGNDVLVNTCAGTSIDLNAYFDTTGLSVSWTVNNGPVIDPAAVTATGTYQLVATNPGGCSDTALVILTANAPPSLGADTSIGVCAGSTVNLLQYFSTGGLTTDWTINGTPVNDPTVVNTAGTYQLIALNTTGCADTALLSILLSPRPVLGNDTAISRCGGENINLFSFYDTSALSASWTIGGVPVVDPSMVSAAGVYQLVATNNGGCTDTATLSLTVHPVPVLGADSTVTICDGNTSDLSVIYNTTGFTANWSFGNLPVADPSAVTSAGTYQLIAAGPGGCADTALVTLVSVPKPSLGPDSSITVCKAVPVDLTGIYTLTNLSASWTTGNTAVTDPSNVVDAGIYQLVAATAGGCSDTAIVTIVHSPRPVIGNDTTINLCEGNSLWLDTLYNTTGLTTAWSSGMLPVNNTIIHDAAIYELEAANGFGCMDTALVTVDVKPNPALGNDTLIRTCMGSSADLSILYNTAGFTVYWQFNNAPVANPATVVDAGIYELAVISPFGCADTALVTLQLNSKPMLGADTAIAVCAGTPVNLLNLYNTGTLTTTWSNNGQVLTNPASITTGGTYQLVGLNASGCSDTAVVTVTVNGKPVLGADTVVGICEGASINLDDLFSTSGNTNAWSLGGNPVPGVTAINLAGSYQLISSTAAGCSDTAIAVVAVHTTPAVVVNNPATTCLPNTVDLTDAAITIGSDPGLNFTYWQDSAASISFNAATAATAGTYYIKGSSSIGCSSVKPVLVSVYPLQLVNAGNDVGICDNDSIARLSVSVSNTGVAATYQWEPLATGGIASPQSASTLVRPTVTPLPYVVTVTDGYGCNYRVSDTVIVSKQPPVPAFAGNDTIAVVGLPHQLFASGGVSYSWSPGNLLNNPSIANPTATIYADSIFFVVEVRDAFGCAGYDTLKVKTYEGITYYVPNAFSPNGDGWNDVFRPIPVGIVSTELFRVFNRYGELMFETNQSMKGWDGNYKGRSQPAANYVWVLRGIGRNGKVIEMKGNVVLVR